MSKTKTEIFDSLYEIYRNLEDNPPVPLLAKTIIIEAMESYARQSCEPLEARVKELEAKLLEALQKNVELCKMGLDLCDKVQSL